MKYLNVPKAIAAWNAIQPLSDRDRERLSRKFTVDFNFNSNHIEGNTLTYGQTELLLLFGKVVGEAEMKDLEEMKASNVGLKMMQEQAGIKDMPLTQNFIRQLHKTLLPRITRSIVNCRAVSRPAMSFTQASTRLAPTA